MRATACRDTLVVDAWPVVGSSVESDPAMRPVPVKCSADAFTESDAWREPDLGPRTRDVERAALGEEVNAAPENRRLDPQRHAHRLADCAGNPERPHRQMARWRRDPCSF